VMESDARRVRGERPVVLISLRDDPSAAAVTTWVLDQLHQHAHSVPHAHSGSQAHSGAQAHATHG